MDAIKLLFVCEDSFDACNMEKLFKDTRFKIVGATNDGKKGIALIEKLKPDLVVCGIAVKGVNGLTLIKKAASLKNNCKIMVLSAIKNDHIMQKAAYCGASEYVITPTTNKSVKEKIIKLSQQNKNVFLQKPLKLPKDLKEKLQKTSLSYGFLSKYNY